MKRTANYPSFPAYELEVINALAVRLDCTISDAQAIIEVCPLVNLFDYWMEDKAVSEAAKDLDEKSLLGIGEVPSQQFYTDHL